MRRYRLAPLVLAAGLAAGQAGGAGWPELDVRALRPDWKRLTAPATGGRMIEVTTPRRPFTLRAERSLSTPIGLFAVGPLIRPSLDGRPLLPRLPAGSAFVILPGGRARFDYTELFDPEEEGRVPVWREESVEGTRLEIDRLADDPVPARLLRDADTSRAGELLYWRDPEGKTTFYWSGELRYCFDLGHPVTGVELQPRDMEGTLLETPAGFRIRLSADGRRWHTAWTARSEGLQRPELQLPAEVRGGSRLCIAFVGGRDPVPFHRLNLRVHLRAPGLAGLAHFPRGSRRLVYRDAGTSSHLALIWWRDARVRAPAPAASAGPGPAVISSGDDRLLLRLAGAQIALPLDRRGRPGGIAELRTGNDLLLLAAPGAKRRPAATLELLEGAATPLPAGFDWDRYRGRYLEQGHWPSLWRRRRIEIDLDAGRFLGAREEGREVVLAWRLHGGIVEWIFSPETLPLAGTTFRGVGMRLRVRGAGLADAVSIRLEFPLRLRPGDWQIEQRFRELLERRLQPVPGRRHRPLHWFGDSQSFLFHTGPGRTLLAFSGRPLRVQVEMREERGRHLYRFTLPLGAGALRETPRLFWLAAPAGAAGRFAASDLWALLRDELGQRYATRAGILPAPLVPTLVWNQPTEEEVVQALERWQESGHPPAPGEGWFDRLARTTLPRAAQVGIRNLIIQSPWQSDAGDPALIASLHAVRALRVSPLLGGRAALGRLVAAAHRLGVGITLWYPSALSLFSPLLEAHPHWLAWKATGVPEDAGWGDIVALDSREPWQRYAIGRLRALHRAVPFDGLWLDSWDGLALATNHAAPQPSPRLDAALGLLRALTRMGLQRLRIEGLGPIVPGDAYGDYETYSGPPRPTPEQVRELQRLRGHEYLLYRIGAGAPLVMPVYHRALAAGGLLNIANLDEVEALGERGWRWLRRINLAHHRALPWMKRRRLLAADRTWLGVAWSRPDRDALLLFAFDQPFLLTLAAGGCIETIDGTPASLHDGQLLTRPWSSYLILPAGECTE